MNCEMKSEALYLSEGFLQTPEATIENNVKTFFSI